MSQKRPFLTSKNVFNRMKKGHESVSIQVSKNKSGYFAKKIYVQDYSTSPSERTLDGRIPIDSFQNNFENDATENFSNSENQLHMFP